MGRFGTCIGDVQTLAMLGESGRALETLAEAVATGWRSNWRVVLEPGSLDSIRDDPRLIEQEAILEADIAAQLDSYKASRALE